MFVPEKLLVTRDMRKLRGTRDHDESLERRAGGPA